MMSHPNTGIPLTLSPAQIVVPEGGLRRAAVPAEQEAGLLASVRVLGVLQPLIVRAHPTEPALWLLVDGRRRLRAAQDAGLERLAAVDRADLSEADAAAVELAANTQRAQMAPVDQWRAMRRLQDLGWPMQGAADALGISLRLARLLTRLGDLHPMVLEAIETHGMPPDHLLRVIANAPAEAQAAALGKQPAGVPPRWWEIAQKLEQRRIPRDRAIFDVETAGVAFDEDLFAEPGAPNQFTTTDLGGFVAAQRAALEARVAASKGKLQLVPYDQTKAAPKLPPAMVEVEWKGGTARLPPGASGYLSVDAHGHVNEIAARPKNWQTKPKPGAAAPAPEEPAEEEDEAAPAPPPPARRITQAGLELLSELRTDGLRAALRDRATAVPPIALLLLALSARNLTVKGERGRSYFLTDFEDIAAATFGAMEDPDHLDMLAREAVARILICRDAKAGNASGACAEWIGQLVGAERTLPRLDRADLLATLSSDVLRDLCATHGVKPGKNAAMRKDLAESTPSLMIDEARFGAPRPELGEAPTCDRAAGADRCQCGWKASDGEDAKDCARGEWQAAMARLGQAPPPPPSPPAPPAPLPEAPKCGWNGESICREDGTTVCERLCPRHARYVEWSDTTAGRGARRRADNAEARANLKRRKVVA